MANDYLKEIRKRSNIIEISNAQSLYLEKLILYFENPTKESKKAFLDSCEKYAILAGEKKGFGKKNAIDVLREMTDEKKLKAWQDIEKLCLRIQDLKLRDRLRAVAEKYNIGKFKWVLE